MKIDNNSALAIGPTALRKVEEMSPGPAAPFLRMACMAMSSSRMAKGVQQSVAVVPSSGGELKYALFCRTRVDSQLHIAERCSSQTSGRFGLGVHRRLWLGRGFPRGRLEIITTWAYGLPLIGALLHHTPPDIPLGLIARFV